MKCLGNATLRMISESSARNLEYRVQKGEETQKQINAGLPLPRTTEKIVIHMMCN